MINRTNGIKFCLQLRPLQRGLLSGVSISFRASCFDKTAVLFFVLLFRASAFCCFRGCFLGRRPLTPPLPPSDLPKCQEQFFCILKKTFVSKKRLWCPQKITKSKKIASRLHPEGHTFLFFPFSSSALSFSFSVDISIQKNHCGPPLFCFLHFSFLNFDLNFVTETLSFLLKKPPQNVPWRPLSSHIFLIFLIFGLDRMTGCSCLAKLRNQTHRDKQTDTSLKLKHDSTQFSQNQAENSQTLKGNRQLSQARIRCAAMPDPKHEAEDRSELQSQCSKQVQKCPFKGSPTVSPVTVFLHVSEPLACSGPRSPADMYFLALSMHHQCCSEMASWDALTQERQTTSLHKSTFRPKSCD